MSLHPVPKNPPLCKELILPSLQSQYGTLVKYLSYQCGKEMRVIHSTIPHTQVWSQHFNWLGFLGATTKSAVCNASQVIVQALQPNYEITSHCTKKTRKRRKNLKNNKRGVEREGREQVSETLLRGHSWWFQRQCWVMNLRIEPATFKASALTLVLSF